MTAIVSVVLGVLAARRGGWVDSVVQVVTVLGFAIPGFLIALVLVLVFAINLRLVQGHRLHPVHDVANRLARRR